MVKINCSICRENFVLSKFRFLHCGHGFCTRCTSNMTSRPTCAICNTPKQANDPHQIYINFALSSLEKMADVAEGLGQIDDNSPAVSVKKAGAKIRNVTPAVKGKGVQEKLLDVAEGLEQRIYPIFERVETMSKEITGLKAKIAQLEKKNKTLEAAQKDIRLLQQDLDRERALTGATQDDLHKSLEQNQKLQKKIRAQEVELREKYVELVAAKQATEDVNKRRKLAEAKLRGLVQQNRKPKVTSKPSATNPDDSLVVIDTPEFDPAPRLPLVRRHATNADSSQAPLKRVLKKAKVAG